MENAWVLVDGFRKLVESMKLEKIRRKGVLLGSCCSGKPS